MTTLNTIIEEEKKKARKQFDDSPVSLRIDALESYAHVHGWSQFEGRTIQDEIDTIVTTAMQRAYEAGQESDPLKGERRRVIEMIRVEEREKLANDLARFVTKNNDGTYTIDPAGVYDVLNKLK